MILHGIFSAVVYSRVLQVLAGEISPFMCSGSHLVQLDTFPSSVHTILEGVSKCSPSVPIRPCILKVGSLVYTCLTFFVSRDNLQPWIVVRNRDLGDIVTGAVSAVLMLLSKDAVHYIESSSNPSSTESLNFMLYHLYLPSCSLFILVSSAILV